MNIDKMASHPIFLPLWEISKSLRDLSKILLADSTYIHAVIIIIIIMIIIIINILSVKIYVSLFQVSKRTKITPSTV